MKRIVIFTDLDGTLLRTDDYSFEEALPAIEELKRRNIPLVIVSSKTRSEIEVYRKRLSNKDPFVVENGGAIFIPRGYFSPEILGRYGPGRVGDYDAIILGSSYDELRTVMEELREKGYRVKGFGDLSVEEISEITGLYIKEAELSKEREFDEVFLIEDMDRKDEILDFIRERGYEYTTGQFYHIMGGTDKGRAVRILIDLYKKSLGEILTVAIGDSMNDLPMFMEVSHPFAVKRINGTHEQSFDAYPEITKVDGIGPEGWRKVVLDILGRIVDKS